MLVFSLKLVYCKSFPSYDDCYRRNKMGAFAVAAVIIIVTMITYYVIKEQVGKFFHPYQLNHWDYPPFLKTRCNLRVINL